MRIKKFAVTAVCILLIAASFVTSAFANWYDDVKPGSTWIEIEGENFAADTFCGVDALYNENNDYYQCNELIMRFYKEAFGLDIMAYSNTGPVMVTDGYDFVKTSDPKAGDIIYVTAEMRGSATDHWAIVKDYSNGYITMFEQNAVWDGKAARNRQIKYPSDSYYIFTPVSLGDYPEPVPEGVERETTTAPATTKIETTVTAATTKPVTTETTTTTEKALTTNASTTKPVTSTAVSTTVAETTGITQTVEATTQAVTTVKVTQSNTETEVPTTNSDESKTEKKNGFVIPVVGVCAALAVIIVVAVIVIKKKK